LLDAVKVKKVFNYPFDRKPETLGEPARHRKKVA